MEFLESLLQVVNESKDGLINLNPIELENSIAVSTEFARDKARDLIGLSEHEIAAVALFSSGLCSSEPSVLRELNSVLPTLAIGLGVWQDYFNLLSCALRKCPSFRPRRLFRIVKGPKEAYAVGSDIIWPEFAVCTSSLSILGEEARESTTYFDITLTTMRGRQIMDCSLFPNDLEVILPPFSQFIVESIEEINEFESTVYLIERSIDGDSFAGDIRFDPLVVDEESDYFFVDPHADPDRSLSHSSPPLPPPPPPPPTTETVDVSKLFSAFGIVTPIPKKKKVHKSFGDLQQLDNVPVPPPRPTSAPAEESPPGKFSSFFSLFGTKNRTSRSSLVSLGEESRESIHVRQEESDQSPRLIDASTDSHVVLKGEGLFLCTYSTFLVSGGGCGHNTIKIWSQEPPYDLHRTLAGHSSYVFCICVVNQGLLATGGYEEIKLWSTETFKCVGTLRGHGGYLYAICTIGKDKIASAGNDKTIRVWTVGTEYDCIAICRGHTDWIRALCYLGENRMASGSDDKTIKIWSVINFTCLITLSGHSNWVLSLSALSGDRLASGSRDDTVKIWNLESGVFYGVKGSLAHTLEGHESSVRSITEISPDLIASGSRDKTVKIWRFSNAEVRCVATIVGFDEGIYSMCYWKEHLAIGLENSTVRLIKI